MNVDRDPVAKEVDALLVAVSHHQRREALEVLREANRPVAVADLARALARRLAECPDDLEAERQTQRLEIELYHCHLPKLAAAGLIEFDSIQNLVTLTETSAASEILAAETGVTAHVQ